MVLRIGAKKRFNVCLIELGVCEKTPRFRSTFITDERFSCTRYKNYFFQPRYRVQCPQGIDQ